MRARPASTGAPPRARSLSWLFGSLFFGGLFGAALLSGIAAYEVLVTSFADVLGWTRRRAVWTVYGVSLLLAIVLPSFCARTTGRS